MKTNSIDIIYSEEYQKEYLYSGIIGYLFRRQHIALTPKYLKHSNKILKLFIEVLKFPSKNWKKNTN